MIKKGLKVEEASLGWPETGLSSGPWQASGGQRHILAMSLWRTWMSSFMNWTILADVLLNLWNNLELYEMLTFKCHFVHVVVTTNHLWVAQKHFSSWYSGADGGVSSRLCTSTGPEGPGDDVEGNLHQILTSFRNLLNIRKIPMQLLWLLFQNNNNSNKKNNNYLKIKI